MKFIKNIFWNSQEKRLRLVWRLTFQGILLVLLLAISELIISLISASFYDEIPPTYSSEIRGSSSPQMLMIAYAVRGLFLSISIWLAGHFFDRRPFSDFGFRISPGWWMDFFFGISLGGILISIIFLIELAAGWVRPVGFLVSNNSGQPFLLAILTPLIIFITVGFYEELLSRGYQITNLAEGLTGKFINPQTAILLACLLSSVFFGLLHATNPNSTLFSTLNICLAGILLATGFLLTGELAIPIGLHISWNFFQGNIFGFPVSGAIISSATLIQIQQSGRDWITGGAFGPEGGFLGTLSNLLGIVLTILWVKKRSGQIRLHRAISMPPTLHLSNEKAKIQSKVLSPDLFQGISHVIWDWNGTLLDDLELCLDVINAMLKKRNLHPVSRNTYLDIFGFPVSDYYLKLGFDFSKEPFEKISTEFIDSYEGRRSNCKMMEGSTSLLDVLHTGGISQSILSASKREYLDQAVVEYRINHYFSLIDGLDNHHAAGKLSLAQKHLSKLNIDPGTILLVGDTLHDAEIADKLRIRGCVIPNGHHSRERLSISTATLIESLAELKKIFLSS